MIHSPKIGTRVEYMPTKESGIVRSLCDGDDSCFVVYDRIDEQATLTSDWSAQRTRIRDLIVSEDANHE